MASPAPRTVNYVLSEAIYGSLQDRQFQAPINASYQEVALRFLESLLDEWRDKVPFAQQIEFATVEDLINTTFTSVSNVNFILNVKNQEPLTRVTGKDEWYNIQNIIDLNGIPQFYYFDELTQTIDVYPIPNQPNYSFIVWGRTQLSAVQPEDELPANMPFFMVNAIIYELAFRLCAEYGTSWDVKKESVRQNLLKLLNKKKDIDLRTPVQTVFKRSGTRIPGFPVYYFLWGGSNG